VLAFSKHTGAVTTLACSADGRYAATAGADKSVRVWRMGTGAEEAALVGHAAAVSCVAFRPDGRELISCSTDGTVRVWALAADGSRWEEEQRLDMSPATPTALAWSPRATLVAIGCSDKSVALIQADSWRQMARLLGHRGPVNTMAFSDDEGLLASGGADTTVHVWSVKAARAFKVLDGHTDSVTGVAWRRGGGGRAVLATSSMDRTVRVWAVDSGLQLAEESMRDGATGVCWSPDGAWLAASCADCATRLWRWSRVGLPQRVRWERAHLGGVTALACHRDGLRVAVRLHCERVVDAYAATNATVTRS
jgi:WD40 repeat protein